MVGCPIPISFVDFDRIAGLVTSLSLFEADRQDPLYLAPALIKGFLSKQRSGSLLPNLSSLSLGQQNWVQGQGSIGRLWFHDQYSLDFLGVFLSPTVTRLAIKCKHGGLDLAKIQLKAPSITDLRLWLYDPHYSPQSTYQHNQWAFDTIKGLLSWEHLATLSIHSTFFNRSTIVFLGTLPQLTSLEVVCINEATDWEELESRPGSFPCLISFFVENAELQGARHLVEYLAIMKGLRSFHLTTVDTADNPDTTQTLVDCMGNLSRNIPSLSHLTFRPFFLYDEVILQPLRLLNLATLNLHNVIIDPAVAPMILTLQTGLQSLNVSKLEMPMIFLEELAIRFPTLRFLSIMIIFTERLDGRGLRTPMAGPLQLNMGLRPFSGVRVSLDSLHG